ncbi:Ribosomal RNA large subunit methyltransferase M [Gammaproteobacteria bacterium]
MTDGLTGLLLYCRSGFEGECAAEIQGLAEVLGVSGYCRAQTGSAFVEFVIPEPGAACRLVQKLPWNALVFARQMFAARRLPPLPIEDRITPLLAVLAGQHVSGVSVESADTNEAKELLTFARKFSKPLTAALRAKGLLCEGNVALPHLHLFFLDGANAFLGLADPRNSSPWFMGIPRLRFPRGAPSRSALKLEEAFYFFLDDEREKRLYPGMRAVDLGAAPGGWTRLLVNHHIHVTAVDNGPLDPELYDTGLVDHRREDGFRYRPPKPVDWLVCDMVEQPIRVARLIADWAVTGACHAAIFNLKLPMKRRWQEVNRCRELIEERLAAAHLQHRLALRQLYHDREEVTGCLALSRI